MGIFSHHSPLHELGRGLYAAIGGNNEGLGREFLVCCNITLQSSDIPPEMSLGGVTLDTFTPIHDLAVTCGNIREPLGNKGQKVRIYDVNPCKGESTGKGGVRDIHYISMCVHQDLIKGHVIVKDHGGEGSGILVEGICPAQIDIRQDITVQDNEGLPVPEINCVLDPAACPQNFLLHPDFYHQAKGPAMIQVFQNLIMVVVGIHHDPGDPVGFEVLDISSEHRGVGHRHQGFWSILC